MKLIRRLNQPLSAASSALGHQLFDRGPALDDEWLVLLAFSGGGTRAAALSYGVLAELARTTVHKNGRARRMLDEVDAISAVSGGSFTAAYYALYGDGIFSDFERRFLQKDIQSAIWRQIAHPQHWWSLFSKQLGRSELAGDFYDNELFCGATFGDLVKHRNRPNLIINATDMVTGRPFAFTQRFFDLIGSDLMALPLARAVAASSAAPLVLSPLTLRNYAGHDAKATSAFLEHFQADALEDGAPSELTENMVSYLDAVDRPFIHLVDGGVSDNLGLRGLLDVSAMNGGFTELLKRWELAHVRKVDGDRGQRGGAAWGALEPRLESGNGRCAAGGERTCDAPGELADDRRFAGGAGAVATARIAGRGGRGPGVSRGRGGVRAHRRSGGAEFLPGVADDAEPPWRDGGAAAGSRRAFAARIDGVSETARRF